MADQKTKRRSSFTPGELLMFLAGILFCLVLISTALLGNLFARYVTTASGSDNARVAKFGDLTLTETGSFVENNGTYTGIIIPGVNLEKTVTLDFAGSEMATIVFLEVSAPGWSTTDNITFRKGDHLSWSLSEGWLTTEGWQLLVPEDPQDGQYIYFKELAPNTPLTDVNIIRHGTIDGRQAGVITVGQNIKESNIQALGNLNLTFRASVIQNDGSLTPATAWDRLN